MRPRADYASDSTATREEFGEEIVELRRAVGRASVVGHGDLIGGPEARVRHIERRLGLRSDPH